jgi:hypothetical protein
MVRAARASEAIEYPETDEMGESALQWFITKLLCDLVIRHLAARGIIAYVAGNQFFYWIEGDPKTSRAPDLYVVLGLPQDIPDVSTWHTWEGHHPAFALEVASSKWQKDYDELPADYAAMGCKELILFDPGATVRSRRRVRWQIFRPVRGRGFVRVASSMEARVRSTVLDAWLVRVLDKGRPRLRLAIGSRGETLLPTADEGEAAEKTIRAITETQAAAERTARQRAESEARGEAARAQAEAARAQAEAARADEAVREVERLRAELARLSQK